MSRPHGTPATTAPPELRPYINKGLGDENLMERGTTLGDAGSGTPAGFLDAVWVVIQLTGSETVISASHSLGRVPVWAHLWEVEDVNSNNGQLTLTSWAKSTWTASEIKLRISGNGNFTGYRILILVG